MKREEQIMEYLNRNYRKGYSLADLKWALIRQGYLQMEVERCIKIMEEKLARESRIKSRPVEDAEEVQTIVEDSVVEKKGFFRRLFGR